MDTYQELYNQTLEILVSDTPTEFWDDLSSIGKNIYADAYAEVKNDSSVILEQKIDYLLQRRHFRMEKLLVDLAVRYNLSHSMSLISQNNRRHALVYNGDVSMTQSYVQAIGDLPQPAKYREKLANAMTLPRLDLGDEPKNTFIMRELYGLIAHNPVGRRFQEDHQKLGMIQFCLPSKDCKKWAMELSIPEIISAYPAKTKLIIPTRSLPWKSSKDKKDKGESK